MCQTNRYGYAITDTVKIPFEIVWYLFVWEYGLSDVLFMNERRKEEKRKQWMTCNLYARPQLDNTESVLL